jgi:exoribonuclease R
MFTLHISNRDYTEWKFVSNTTLGKPPELSPSITKLFHGDQVDETGKLINSHYRSKEHICGVLLTGEKTYGRAANGKLLYKCVPDAEHLPMFLVPYEEKNIGFSKNKSDTYISFQIKEWREKHPIGSITNTFGQVHDIEAYIAYQMACKEINDSIKSLNAASLRALRETTLGPIPLYCEGVTIEDRRTYPIISIDPEGCNDIDDAIGFRETKNKETILSIYIANVPMMIEYLNLWTYLTDRIATIYLPSKKIPMLPTSLSENICSLKEKEDRVAFVLDVCINNGLIQSIRYTSTIIRVEKNYAYHDAELIARKDYKNILQTVKTLNDEHFRYVENITNSHEVVEYCMLLMNHECAKLLAGKKSGIFRSAGKKEVDTNVVDTNAVDTNTIPSELKHILQNVAGEYCAATNIKPHELIGEGLECYIHMTSPIRRVVDIVNMYELLKDRFKWSAEAKSFAEKWQGSLTTLNTKTKAIRKLQNEIELLNIYEKNPEQTYMGMVFNKTEVMLKNMPIFKYTTYIPEIKLLTSVLSTKEFKNYGTLYFSVHLFMDEAKMTKKIRLQITI